MTGLEPWAVNLAIKMFSLISEFKGNKNSPLIKQWAALLIEARELGRKDVLDRLPSEDEYQAQVLISVADFYRLLKPRLMGHKVEK